jgi:hypothetical protein
VKVRKTSGIVRKEKKWVQCNINLFYMWDK